MQVAVRQSPHLRCVVSLYSTDDRYSDDVHYIGVRTHTDHDHADVLFTCM